MHKKTGRKGIKMERVIFLNRIVIFIHIFHISKMNIYHTENKSLFDLNSFLMFDSPNSIVVISDYQEELT